MFIESKSLRLSAFLLPLVSASVTTARPAAAAATSSPAATRPDGATLAKRLVGSWVGRRDEDEGDGLAIYDLLLRGDGTFSGICDLNDLCEGTWTVGTDHDRPALLTFDPKDPSRNRVYGLESVEDDVLELAAGWATTHMDRQDPALAVGPVASGIVGTYGDATADLPGLRKLAIEADGWYSATAADGSVTEGKWVVESRRGGSGEVVTTLSLTGWSELQPRGTTVYGLRASNGGFSLTDDKGVHEFTRR